MIMSTHTDLKEENGYDMMIERFQEQINSQLKNEISAYEIISDYLGYQSYLGNMGYTRSLFLTKKISDERIKEIKNNTIITKEMRETGKAMSPILEPSFIRKPPGFIPTRDRKYTKGVFRRANTTNDESGDE